MSNLTIPITEVSSQYGTRLPKRRGERISTIKWTSVPGNPLECDEDLDAFVHYLVSNKVRTFLPAQKEIACAGPPAMAGILLRDVMIKKAGELKKEEKPKEKGNQQWVSTPFSSLMEPYIFTWKVTFSSFCPSLKTSFKNSFPSLSHYDSKARCYKSLLLSQFHCFTRRKKIFPDSSTPFFLRSLSAVSVRTRMEDRLEPD